MQNKEDVQETAGEIQKKIRVDGYKNLMNKYGTQKDASEHYRFEQDSPVTDIELELNYEENGLFAKIIDIPADDAISSGLKYGINDADIEAFIDDSLDELDFKEKIAEAIKWARLFGGALIVMFIDDGGDLQDPVDWDNIQGIDELMVFERPAITPDYTSIYNNSQIRNGQKVGRRRSKFGMPEFYNISPIDGSTFRVHESRCLLFRNTKMPRYTNIQEYRYFGIPEYKRIHKNLQETITSHGNGVKLLDRAIQAVYKMMGLAEKLLTDVGTEEVLQRLNAIDMAKGILNSIAIDAEGEEYHYETVTFSGVKEIIDSTCNMLSAVTNIPQTKLFGRSPAGENSTGEGDMENYYNFVGKIQEINIKNNTKTLIDIILTVGKYKGQFENIPKYKLEFNPLWSLSEKEQADVSNAKANTELVKAQTAQIYVDMQALDSDEVRKRLAESGEFTINDILSEEVWPEFEDQKQSEESVETTDTALTADVRKEQVADSENEVESVHDSEAIIPTGCGVIVIKDGKVLVGKRKDNGLLCGPGGHIEIGESPEEAAIRETREEFGINIAEIIPISVISGMPKGYCPSQIFLCTEFYGTPICFNDEMESARFEPISDILKKELFLPFKLSLKELLKQLSESGLTPSTDKVNISVEADGGPGSGRYPKGSGKSKESLPMTSKEKAKVSHDINNLYHSRYEGKRSCFIRTRSNEVDSPTYLYRFRNKGFDNYDIYRKEAED